MKRPVRKRETYDWAADETKAVPPPETASAIQPKVVKDEFVVEEEAVAVEFIPQYDPFEEHCIQQARGKREREREIQRQEALLPFELKLMEQFSPHELGLKSNVVRPKMFDDVGEDHTVLMHDDEEEDVRGRVAEMGVEEEVFESLRGNKYQMTADPDHQTKLREFNPIDDSDEEARQWEEQQLRKVKLGSISTTESLKKTTAAVKRLAHIPLEQQLVNLQAEQSDLEASLNGLREQLGRLEGRVIELEAEAALETQRMERNAFYRKLTLLFQRLDRESQAVIQQLETGETVTRLLAPAYVIVDALTEWSRLDPTGYEQSHAHLYVSQLLEPHARIAIQSMQDLDLDGLRVRVGLADRRWDQGWQEMLGQVIIPRLTGFDQTQLVEQLSKHLGAENRLVKLTRDLFKEF